LFHKVPNKHLNRRLIRNDYGKGLDGGGLQRHGHPSNGARASKQRVTAPRKTNTKKQTPWFNGSKLLNNLMNRTDRNSRSNLRSYTFGEHFRLPRIENGKACRDIIFPDRKSLDAELEFGTRAHNSNGKTPEEAETYAPPCWHWPVSSTLLQDLGELLAGFWSGDGNQDLREVCPDVEMYSYVEKSSGSSSESASHHQSENHLHQSANHLKMSAYSQPEIGKFHHLPDAVEYRSLYHATPDTKITVNADGDRVTLGNSFKVYVYDPSDYWELEKLTAGPYFCRPPQQGNEVDLHHWFLSCPGCRTRDPDEADFFFVPQYSWPRSVTNWGI
jgi:hypothetical protein